MNTRNSNRWLAPILIAALCAGVIVAKGLFATATPTTPRQTVTAEQPKPAVAKPKRPMTAMPNVKLKKGEPWPGEWIKYPPDEVLPYGISIEVTYGVITGVVDENPEKPDHELLGTRYVIGDYDSTDVTAALWRQVDMELPKEDGSISKLNVARPLWWMHESHAKAGTEIEIGMHEAGLFGQAKVLKVSPFPFDSRDNQNGANLVIGKIEHHNAEVWDLVFDNNTAKPLGVTANHPIMSVDRKDWVPAGELEINERVEALNGTSTLTAKSHRPTRETVYNLEVHRSHAYHVGDDGILAHNTGIGCAPALHEIIPYARRAPGFQRHHGVLDAWAQANLSNYNKFKAPTVVMTKIEHDATRRVFGQWRYQQTGSINGAIDWTSVTNREMQTLTNQMFDAANIPGPVRDSYFQALNRFLYSGGF